MRMMNPSLELSTSLLKGVSAELSTKDTPSCCMLLCDAAIFEQQKAEQQSIRAVHRSQSSEMVPPSLPCSLLAAAATASALPKEITAICLVSSATHACAHSSNLRQASSWSN